MIARKPRKTKVIRMPLVLLTILTAIAEAVTAIVVVALSRGMMRCVTTGVPAT